MGRAAATDAELIAASRRGDATAFGAIVERYQRAVCAVSYSGTGDRTLSEDVAQDTFVTAWRQLAALREIERLPAWLCGIARNLARAARRRRGRELPLDDEELVAAATPFDAVSDHEAEQVVAAALANVPATYREPLVLFYCEHQSVKAVAHALGISEDATHQRLSRGRQHLAAGVNGLVERTLERRQSWRNLAPAVVAAIAVVAGSSHVDASTTSTKGSTMFKTGVAIAIIAAIAGTGYLAQRSSADPAPTQARSAPSASDGSVTTERAPGARSATLPAMTASGRAAALANTAAAGASGSGGGVGIDCTTAARRIADLGMEMQPDLAQLTPEMIARDQNMIVELVAQECTARHWSPEFLACIVAGNDVFSIGAGCAHLAPASAGSASVSGPGVLVPQILMPQPAYTGTDFGCTSVGTHVASLLVPDPAALASLPDADRQGIAEGIERTRAVMPDHIEAACEQGAWPESRRRCVLAATTKASLDACMAVKP